VIYKRVLLAIVLITLALSAGAVGPRAQPDDGVALAAQIIHAEELRLYTELRNRTARRLAADLVVSE